MAKLCEANNIATKGFSPDFLEVLTDYEWPGNVRELINTIERVIAESLDAPILFPYHLPMNIRIKAKQSSLGDVQSSFSSKSKSNLSGLTSKYMPTLKEFRETGIAKIEKEYLEKLIMVTKGDVKESGRISGLSRSRLYGLLKKHNIGKP